MTQTPFWKTKTLHTMTQDEWESLCDGCGKCCLNKLIDEDTGHLAYTSVGCVLLSNSTGKCVDYENRKIRVPSCVQLTPDLVNSINWLPRSCAYRLVKEGKDLYWWHPLVSGDPETVHMAKMSVKGRIKGYDDEIKLQQQLNYIVFWPNEMPKIALEKPESI